jgi:hypothetical protein
MDWRTRKAPDRRPDAPGYGGRVGEPGRPGGPARPHPPGGTAGPPRPGKHKPPKPEKPKPGKPEKPEKPKPVGPGGEILFFAWTVDGTEPTSQEDIFGFDTGTGTVRRLTDESSGVPFISDRDPSWSPDRSRIVHMRADATSMRLALTSASGAPLGEIDVAGTLPIWLDGDTVLCAVHRLGPAGFFDRSDLVAVAVPGAAETTVAAAAPGEFFHSTTWHPDAGLAAELLQEDPGTGATISTGIVHAPAAAVQAALAGGAPLTSASFSPLNPGTEWDAGPAWSPDGTRLAFSTLRSCATLGPGGIPVLQSEIALLDPAVPGSVTLLTDDSAAHYSAGVNDGSPAWSADGTWLAWARGHEDDWTQIVLQQLSDPSTRTVALDGRHWFRHGLDW